MAAGRKTAFDVTICWIAPTPQPLANWPGAFSMGLLKKASFN